MLGPIGIYRELIEQAVIVDPRLKKQPARQLGQSAAALGYLVTFSVPARDAAKPAAPCNASARFGAASQARR